MSVGKHDLDFQLPRANEPGQRLEAVLDVIAFRQDPAGDEPFFDLLGQRRVAFVDRRHVLLGKIGPAQQPHLAAVEDQLRDAGRGHGEHRAGEVTGGPVITNAGRHRGNEELAEPIVTRPVGDVQVQVPQVWHR